MVDEFDAIEMAGPNLDDLADAAGGRVAVAFGAALCVIKRPEAFAYVLVLVESVFISIELALGRKTVRLVIEPRRCFGSGLSLNLTASGLLLDRHGQTGRHQQQQSETEKGNYLQCPHYQSPPFNTHSLRDL